MLIVALDGSGDFQSIQAAIDSLKGKILPLFLLNEVFIMKSCI